MAAIADSAAPRLRWGRALIAAIAAEVVLMHALKIVGGAVGGWLASRRARRPERQDNLPQPHG